MCELEIVSEGSLRISDLEKFKETRIKIKDWSQFLVRKYVTRSPYEGGKDIELDWTKSFETFEFIQELILSERLKLTLNGFSKESGAWLTYTFIEFEYEISIDGVI